jgi:hypothetical protein
MTTKMEMMQIVITRECLKKQIEEYELLQSMYANPGEFQSDNPHLINDFRDFLDGFRERISEKLDYRLKLQLNDKIKMELSVTLSQYYPTHEQPMLMIRTDSLNKHQESAIKKAIENYIESEIDKSEAYMFQVITWLQDNIDNIVQVSECSTKNIQEIENGNVPLKMSRAWLWSHHIYSKIKRQDIMKLTRDYDLNGFMWPGKPGILCFEGASDNVDEIVKIIKGWQWQKLKVVKIEKAYPNSLHFEKFKEILSNDNDGENSKMDTSAFFKYLDNHKSDYMKKDLFGFD